MSEVVHREAEVYADMILTGQKPVAMVPSIDETVSRVAEDKGLAWIRFKDQGTFMFQPGFTRVYGSLLRLTEHLLTSGDRESRMIAYHWIRGHMFGYSEREILKHIERCGP